MTRSPVIARLAWHGIQGRRNPGWKARLATIRGLAAGTPEALATWREATVAEHLRWARARVPWFSRIAADAPLRALPVLARRDLQEHREDLVDASRPRADLRPDSSGGSTGEPVSLYHDAEYDTWTFATEAWVHEWWGLRPWCRTAVLWGDDRVGARPPWRERVEARLLRVRHLNAFAMTDADMARFAGALERFRPDVLQGYATALDLFASFLARERRWEVRPRMVRSGAEALSPEARARIGAAFSCPVRDFYGSRESASLAAECVAGGLHVLAHGKVIEVVDESGAPAAPGVPGRVLVTDLTNRAFGLIRYENGDVASWAPPEPPCPCGCPYPRLERVHGRTSDFVTTPSGQRIHGEWFTHLFYGRDGVRRFQVRQSRREAVEVWTQGEAGEAELAPLLARIRERLGPEVAVAWRRVDAIPATPSGKHRFTVSEVPFLQRGPP